MRHVLAALPVVVLLAVGVSGCASGPNAEGGGEATPPTSSPTTTVDSEAAERAWLGRYALWVGELRVALEHEDAAALGSCTETLEGELGDVPDEFAQAKRILERACEGYANGVREEEPFQAWARASRLVRRANSLLPTPQPTERLPLPVAGGLVRDSRVEPLLTKVANDIAAPAAQVRCWSRRDWARLVKETFRRRLDLAGFASHQFKRAHLASDICDDLANLAYTEQRPHTAEQAEVAFAVATLMHEAGHLNESGDFYGAGENEPLAECWGMQHIRPAARALGVDKAYADELAEVYWLSIYPNQKASYRTPKCRNGGQYDVRPGSDIWP